MQKFLDFIFFPLRCIFPNNEYISFLRLTPLADERFLAVENEMQNGKFILDIGCGDNRLIKKYKNCGGNGIGIDIAPNLEADIEVQASDSLQFSNNYFDYITIIASINHIPTREDTLREVFRCLKPGGSVIITNLSPLVGYVGHKIWHVLKSDLDMHHRGQMEVGEKYGLNNKYIVSVLRDIGFIDIKVKKFSLGFNNLIVAFKP